MPTSTYFPLANITLGSSASSITFSSIPTSGYRDLILVGDGTLTGTSVGVGLRYNSDSGTNYSSVLMAGNGTSASGAGNTNTNIADVAFFDNTSKMNFITQIMDYSATDKHKTLLSRSNQGATLVIAYSARWANTAAITSVEVLALTNAFASGTTLALYGIAS
jgi:hypothetical protein